MIGCGNEIGRDAQVNETDPFAWVYYDVHTDVDDDKNNLPKIDDLSKLLYPEEEQLFQSEFISNLSSPNFQATCIQIVCTAHMF